MKPSPNPFTLREINQGRAVEIWLGEPDGQESEYVATIAKSWIPQIIAVLRSVNSNGK